MLATLENKVKLDSSLSETVMLKSVLKKKETNLKLIEEKLRNSGTPNRELNEEIENLQNELAELQKNENEDNQEIDTSLHKRDATGITLSN